MKNILVIGASGFVGRNLCLSLSKSNFNVTAYSRSPIDLGSSITHLSHPSLQSIFSDPSSLTKFDSIVYAAGRAHSVSGILSISCVSKYLNDNTFDPLYIARLASLAGVERFIYISSIKVNGDSTSHSDIFTPFDKHCPEDMYALSKSLAENLLGDLLRSSTTSLIVVRPPLIYGPGVKGNLFSLIKLLKYGLPVPFSCLNNNRRSFLSIYNFNDFIRVLLLHKHALGQTFLVRDPSEISTYHFIRSFCSAFGLPFKSFPFPRSFLRLVFLFIGKKSSFYSISSSLRMDISSSTKILDWSPPFSLRESLQRYSKS